jgi:DNA polymerase III epsilon subunit-like protein
MCSRSNTGGWSESSRSATCSPCSASARAASLPRHADPANPRWVVVDVETAGLDPRRATLLAVGAVADGTIRLADHFEVVLRQPVASAPANILVHGIGHAAQTGGVPPDIALADYLDYLGDSPLVAFHATALARACRRELGHTFDWRWLDLAYVAPARLPRDRRHSLDDWCARFGIVNTQRHHALADAGDRRIAAGPAGAARRSRTRRFRPLPQPGTTRPAAAPSLSGPARSRRETDGGRPDSRLNLPLRRGDAPPARAGSDRRKRAPTRAGALLAANLRPSMRRRAARVPGCGCLRPDAGYGRGTAWSLSTRHTPR